jgi:hypothetical protein
MLENTEKVARDKHSSLFYLFNSVEEKNVITLAPGIKVIKIFMALICKCSLKAFTA